MKTVVITGAHGFLGRWCACEFAAAGWRVVGIGLGEWSDEAPADFGIGRWETAEVTLDSLRALDCTPEAVVHCAGSGSVGFSMVQPLADFRMTVATTAEVLEYMRLHSPAARLVYPSSAAVYGCRDQGPIHEDDFPAPVSPYGAHKLMAEDLCRSCARSFGLAVSVVRFFSLYGPGLRKQLLWDACGRIAAAQPGETLEFFGTGEETRDWLHAADAAALVRTLAEAPSAGLVVNGGSGRSVTVRDALERLLAESGVQAAVSFNRREREGDPRHYQADISRAVALGWSPGVGLSDGIAEYAAWFMAGAR